VVNNTIPRVPARKRIVEADRPGVLVRTEFAHVIR
jgi:hypothetical protein